MCCTHIDSPRRADFIKGRLRHGLAGRVVQECACFQTVGQRLDKLLCVQENRMRKNQSRDKEVRKVRKGDSLDGMLGRVNKKQIRCRDPLQRIGAR